MDENDYAVKSFSLTSNKLEININMNLKVETLRHLH